VVTLHAIKQKSSELSITVEEIAKSAAGKARAVALWTVPHYSRLGLYFQAIFIICTLVWFAYKPHWAVQGPGVAMAFLAVAATWMAVRGPDLTRIEGGVWILIAFGLFFVQMHFVGAERKSHDAEQAELRTREETTRREQNRSFNQLVQDGKHLFNELGEEKTLTQQNLEHITGGTGYCWVVPVDPLDVGLGGDPAHRGNNWWQIALKNEGKVVLPTCDIHLVPFPTVEEHRNGVMPSPPDIFYHFERVPVILRRYYRYTDNFIKGDRIYSGVIQTPTRSFNEVIKFTPNPKDPTRFLPSCTVSEQQSGKILEKDCYPQ
jgi:hypothetical protein